MNRDNLLNLMGIVSPISLLLCFGGAVLGEVIASEKLTHMIEISLAVSLVVMAITFAAYLWEIALNRRAYKKSR